MKNFIKIIVYILVLILLFIISIFLLFSYTGFSQGKTNIDKLELNFPVNFSEKEIKFLNSLSETDFEKLIKIIQLITTTKSSPLTTNLIQSRGTTTKTTQTIYSNTPSPQTPYYNQDTGQYQSTPTNNSASSQYTNNLPFSGENRNIAPNTTRLGSVLQGVNQVLSDANLDVKNIDPMCIPNYGIKHMSASGCSSLQGLNPKIKRITMEACTLIKQQIPVNSAYRSPYCNEKVGGAESSNHMRGTAIDVSLGLLGEKARTVVLKFKQSGLTGFRCYGGTGHTHFSLSLTERDDIRKCPQIVQLIYR